MADFLTESHKFYHSLSVSITEPELEYDDSALELAGDEVLDATTPDVESSTELLNDDDFERVLGTAHQIVHAQQVLETEFADISRSGVLQVADGDDGRCVILFSACRLPPNSADKGHDRLLRYVKATLETFVTNDYAIVYLHHGLTRENRPGFGWLRKAYQEIDRKFKKNLKALYIVHPTGWIRIFWTVVKPFISSKFTRKVMYVNLLSELANYVDLSRFEIPQTVRAYDQELDGTRSAKSGSAGRAVISPVPSNSRIDASFSSWSITSRQSSAPSLQHLRSFSGGRVIPHIVEDTITYLRRHGLAVEGLFRRSPALSDVRAVQASYRRGVRVDFSAFADGVNVAASSLKTFLRELGEPVCTLELFDEAVRIGMLCDGLQSVGGVRLRMAQQLVCENLPPENYDLLRLLCLFLREVADNAGSNQMHAANLAIVFGPNLVWSHSPAQSLALVRPINAFVQLLITDASDIFVKGSRFA